MVMPQPHEKVRALKCRKVKMACLSRPRKREGLVCMRSPTRISIQFRPPVARPSSPIRFYCLASLPLPSAFLHTFATSLKQYTTISRLSFSTPWMNHAFLRGHHLLQPWRVQSHHCRGNFDDLATPGGMRAIPLTKNAKGLFGSG